MTTAELTDYHGADSLEEARASLGDMLGLDGPVQPEVARRALLDPKYAMYLMLVRDSPTLRDKLLNHPDNRVHSAAAVPQPSDEATPQSAVALSAKAARSMARWAKTGFRKADEEMVARRWAACQSCEFLADPPNRLVYKGLNLIFGAESKICSACGCMARRKVVIPTEACPRTQPGDPALTRWGEPVASATSTGLN